MYDYHDNLRATHAASSPWWAWPLDLKPVWFYQEYFTGGAAGGIYDTGNLVVFTTLTTNGYLDPMIACVRNVMALSTWTGSIV